MSDQRRSLYYHEACNLVRKWAKIHDDPQRGLILRPRWTKGDETGYGCPDDEYEAWEMVEAAIRQNRSNRSRKFFLACGFSGWSVAQWFGWTEGFMLDDWDDLIEVLIEKLKTREAEMRRVRNSQIISSRSETLLS